MARHLDFEMSHTSERTMIYIWSTMMCGSCRNGILSAHWLHNLITNPFHREHSHYDRQVQWQGDYQTQPRALGVCRQAVKHHLLTFQSQIASSYGSTFAEAIARMAEFVQNNMNFIGLQRVDAQHSAIRVLDYACGPGTMTDVFLQHATELVGLDISQKMIERYNKTRSFYG